MNLVGNQAGEGTWGSAEVEAAVGGGPSMMEDERDTTRWDREGEDRQM